MTRRESKQTAEQLCGTHFIQCLQLYTIHNDRAENKNIQWNRVFTLELCRQSGPQNKIVQWTGIKPADNNKHKITKWVMTLFRFCIVFRHVWSPFKPFCNLEKTTTPMLTMLKNIQKRKIEGAKGTFPSISPFFYAVYSLHGGLYTFHKHYFSQHFAK